MTPVPLCIFFPLSPRPVARSGAYDRSTNETGEVVVRAGIATLNTRGGSGLFVPLRWPLWRTCGIHAVRPVLSGREATASQTVRVRAGAARN
jgi:hypothetical protein